MQYRITFKKPPTQSQHQNNQDLTSTEDSSAGNGSIYSDLNLQSQYLCSDDSVCNNLERIFSQTYNAIVYHTLRDQTETLSKEDVVEESGFSVKIANVDEQSRLELLSVANVYDKNGEGLVRGECLINIFGVTPGGRLVQLNDAPLVASWEPVLPYQPHTAENFDLDELIEHFQACFQKYYKAA